MLTIGGSNVVSMPEHAFGQSYNLLRVLNRGRSADESNVVSLCELGQRYYANATAHLAVVNDVENPTTQIGKVNPMYQTTMRNSE